jgi:hypothetical protein
MRDPMNEAGFWPAVKPGDLLRVDFVNGRRLPPDSRFDFAEGIPERVDALSTATLAVAIFLLGVIVSAIGIGVANGTLDWWRGVFYVCGLVVGFGLRVLMESRG